jgi:hypothetical protein
MKVIMNGVDVTEVSCNFTSGEWDELRACVGHTYVAQRREYVSGRHRGRGNNRGGRGRGGRNGGGRYNDNTTHTSNKSRNAEAATNTNTTDIVEYDASNSTIATQSSSPGRGGQSGGRFGPRRNN